MRKKKKKTLFGLPTKCFHLDEPVIHSRALFNQMKENGRENKAQTKFHGLF